MIFYSQNFEDVLLWRAFGSIPHGKYIDIGAHHPNLDSVSKVFYEQGWRGIHIEPLPSYAEMLRNDRLGDQVIEAAVSSQPGILHFFDIQGSGLSTADPEIAEFHRAQGWNVCQIAVPTVTLDNIFGMIDDGIVHWLKIDVEGHERQVLEGWRVAVLPWVVVVESTYPCSQIDTHQAWEELLLRKGYSYVHHDGLNRYYTSPEHPELVPAFQYGANVFDGFQLADHHWAVAAQHQQLETQRTQAQAREVELTQHAAQQAEHLQAQIAEAHQLRLSYEAQQQNALAELHQQLETQRAQAQAREDELRQHTAQQLDIQHAAAAQQIESLQSQITEAQGALLERERTINAQIVAQHTDEHLRIGKIRQAAEAHIAQLQQELAELRQQLEAQRTQAQAREDELRQHAAQQLQALQAAAAQQAEQLQVQMNAQIAAMLASIQQQAAYAQGLAGHIDAMRSTWWWRFSMLWRRPSKWRLQPAPLLTHPFNMPQGSALFAAANPNPSAAPPRGETPNAPQPTANTKQPNPVFSQALPIMRLAMPIQHITELFALDGHVFIAEVYRNLLKREPDEHGMAYYLGRLAQGHGKAAVIAQLAQSPECRPLDEIKGLKKLVADERRAQHWFWGRFGHRNRVERILQSGLLPVARIEHQLQALHEAILLQGQQIGDLATQVASHREIQLDEAPRLPAETVRQCYVDILGREPESEDVIKHHARSPSREALQEQLINSEEFQHKLLALPEYARLIFKRQIHQQTALQGG